MRTVRRLLTVFLIALFAASAVALPGPAFAAVQQDSQGGMSASDCDCDGKDCAHDTACHGALCVSACSNWIVACLPAVEGMPLASETASAEPPDIGRAALDRPPPLPPPIA